MKGHMKYLTETSDCLLPQFGIANSQIHLLNAASVVSVTVVKHVDKQDYIIINAAIIRQFN